MPALPSVPGSIPFAGDITDVDASAVNAASWECVIASTGGASENRSANEAASLSGGGLLPASVMEPLLGACGSSNGGEGDRRCSGDGDSLAAVAFASSSRARTRALWASTSACVRPSSSTAGGCNASNPRHTTTARARQHRSGTCTRKLSEVGTRRQRRVYARRGTLAGGVALPSTQLALQRPSYESARLARTAGAKWSGRAGPGAGAGALGISESALRSGRSGGTAPCSSSRRPGPPVESLMHSQTRTCHGGEPAHSDV